MHYIVESFHDYLLAHVPRFLPHMSLNKTGDEPGDEPGDETGDEVEEVVGSGMTSYNVASTKNAALKTMD